MESYETNICGRASEYGLPSGSGKYNTVRLSDYRMMSRYRVRDVGYSGNFNPRYSVKIFDRNYRRAA